MKTTIDIDDELLTAAQQLTGTTQKSTLVEEGLRALIARKNTRQLARLGGTETQLQFQPYQGYISCISIIT